MLGVGLGLFIVKASLVSPGHEVVLKIKPKDTYAQVLNQLKSNPNTQHIQWFEWGAKIFSYDKKVHSGRYVVSSNQSIIQTIRKLRSGNQDAVNLVINNVTFRDQLASRVAHYLNIDSNDFLNILTDTTMARQYGLNPEDFWGMFLCNTYQIYWDISMKDLIAKMNKEYKRFWTEEKIQQATAKGLLPIQVIILASIVQKETNYKPEYGKIASVYLNRLKMGMPLQADPTVKYALKDMSIKRIINKDLQFDSPYNTYKYLGLPPGPVGLPELDVVKSVLNAPLENNLYFCAIYGSGKHVFAKTFQEHLINARAYQKALNQQSIYR